MPKINRSAAEYALAALMEISKQPISVNVADELSASIELGKRIVSHDIEAAYELYDYIDNEDNCFSIIQEEAASETEALMFNCIIYAAAILVRYAYEEKGSSHFPEPIEQVDEKTPEMLQHALRELFGTKQR